MNKNAPAYVKQTFEIREHSLKSDIEKLQRSQLRMKSYHDKKKKRRTFEHFEGRQRLAGL